MQMLKVYNPDSNSVYESYIYSESNILELDRILGTRNNYLINNWYNYVKNTLKNYFNVDKKKGFGILWKFLKITKIR